MRISKRNVPRVIVAFALSSCKSDRDKLLATFQIHPDFQIELAAIEPVAFDPIDLEFDEQGRAFVLEMPGYPFVTEKGRVIMILCIACHCAMMISGSTSNKRSLNGSAPPPAVAALDCLIQSEAIAGLRSSWRVQKALGLQPSKRQAGLLQKAAELVVSSSASTAQRLEYLALLEFAKFFERETALFELLEPRHPNELQLAAIAQLGRVKNHSAGNKLLSRWKHFGPEVHTRAGDILLYRAENHDLLLTALEKKKVPLGELNFHLERLRTLLFSEDAAIRRRAEVLFSDAGVVTRRQAMEKMRPALAPKAVSAKPSAGRK